VAEIDLVLGGVDGIDGAGAVSVVLARMRHLHFAAVSGDLVAGRRGFGRRLGLRSCDHRAGSTEIDAERHRRILFGESGWGSGAGDEAERHQAHQQRTIRTRDHLELSLRASAPHGPELPAGRTAV
jgi:hypothetical protein